MNKEAIKVLKKAAELYDPNVKATRKPHNYISNNLEDVVSSVLNSLSPEGLNRSELRELCIDTNTSSERAFLEVMTWGGIRANSLRSSWKKRNAWLPLLDQIRKESSSRSDDYSEFMKLRKNNKLPGVRAPYFTKLMFFLRPKQDGYIMDQWVAKSVNLLFERTIVSLPKSGLVKDNVDVIQYESFCYCIEEIAGIIERTPQETEAILFCKGGKKPGIWRQYVKKNWRP